MEDKDHSFLDFYYFNHYYYLKVLEDSGDSVKKRVAAYTYIGEGMMGTSYGEEVFCRNPQVFFLQVENYVGAEVQASEEWLIYPF